MSYVARKPKAIAGNGGRRAACLPLRTRSLRVLEPAVDGEAHRSGTAPARAPAPRNSSTPPPDAGRGGGAGRAAPRRDRAYRERKAKRDGGDARLPGPR